jgi:quinol monooxygenase YgiN
LSTKEGEGPVAVVVMLDMPGVTEAQYATAREVLGAAPPPGNLVHVAGPTVDGWRVVEVWKSPKLMDNYFQSPATRTAFQAAGIRSVQPAILTCCMVAAAAGASW